MPASPLAYAPDVERPSPDEPDADRAIQRSMRHILETTAEDYGHPARSVHAKSHALLAGELTVLPDLPPTLAQGLFATPGRHPAVLRFSTNPGDILDDTVSAPRGLAIKVLDVQGERLPGSERATTQDFVLVNAPAFVAPNPAKFAQSLKLLAATTDTGQGWKKLLSAVLRAVVRLAGPGAGPLKGLGGHPMTHPLGETFYSQTPFRYGGHVAKFAVAPASSNLRALKDRPVELAGRPNGLRHAMSDALAHEGAEWELQVQLRTDERSMPIEDATVPWPESRSPFVPVARLSVPAQPAWNEDRARLVDDAMAFSPWHGILAHQPLGGINRARRGSYAMSAAFRGARIGCPMREPSGKLDLGSAPTRTYGRTPGREGRRPRTPDAIPGTWGQPLNPAARGVAAGALGGLAAGLVTSVVFGAIQAYTGEPSELVRLKRRTGRKLGRPERRDMALTRLRDEVISHTGHLALSTAAGAVYGAVQPSRVPPALAGAGFGLGFHALAFGVVGPASGVTPPPWRGTGANLAQHGAVHLLFGVTTALLAERLKPKL